MKLFKGISIILLITIAYLLAGDKPKPEQLIGTWKVDLRPTPDAAEYFQEFVISKVDGKTFQGTFYGTEIKHATINNDWGKIYFAFVTGDGSGAYNTSGFLDGDTLRGTTLSTGREFLSVWTAIKIE